MLVWFFSYHLVDVTASSTFSMEGKPLRSEACAKKPAVGTLGPLSQKTARDWNDARFVYVIFKKSPKLNKLAGAFSLCHPPSFIQHKHKANLQIKLFGETSFSWLTLAIRGLWQRTVLQEPPWQGFSSPGLHGRCRCCWACAPQPGWDCFERGLGCLLQITSTPS